MIQKDPNALELASKAAGAAKISVPWAAMWKAFNTYNSALFSFIRHPLITALGSLAIFLVALHVINNELSRYSVSDLQRAIENIGVFTLAGAALAAVCSYASLIVSDRFALAMIGKRLPFARTARASLAAYALANTLGYSWATAATARQRLFRKWGLLPREIGSFSFVTGNAVQVGGLAAAGLGLMISAGEVADHGPLNWVFWFGCGLVILIPAGLWLLYARNGPRSTDVTGAPLYRPKPWSAAAHIGTIIIDWLFAALILYFLLPNHGGWSFPAFLAVFVLAGMLGAISGAPGGLGVFEAAILTLAPVSQDTPGAAIALLLYRLIYNIIPLAVATIILGLDHAAPAARPAARAAQRVTSQIGTAAQEFAPRICAILVFATGFGMLCAVATPPITSRLLTLSEFGLSFVSEIANGMSAMLGIALLFVGVGLWRYRRTAWLVAIVLLSLSVVTSLFKGLSLEEAFFIVCVTGLLLAARESFDRRGDTLGFKVGPKWFALIFGAIATVLWIANFAHNNQLWQTPAWQEFSITNDLGRTQRALVWAFTGAVCLVVFQLSRRRPLNDDALDPRDD